jgi:L-rhamnose isomerase
MSALYQSAREQFAAWGVDTDAALATLAATPVSLHCWQGDDVAGFENASGNAGSGCVATGMIRTASLKADLLNSSGQRTCGFPSI